MEFLTEYNCSNSECNKTVTQENARCCSHCGRGGDRDDDDENDDSSITIYCVTCDIADCIENPCTVDEHETCWKSHLPGKAGFARKHQMLNPNAQIIIEAVTYSEGDQARQQKLHEQDRNARWFNVKRNPSGHDTHRNYAGQGVPMLHAYDRFRQLCDPHVSGNAETTNHYPRFVSFIGDTCAGKSSLVRAMIMMGLAQRAGVISGEDMADHGSVSRLVAAMGERTTEWPVTRSANSGSLKNPTTQGVHLYRDEGTSACPPDVEAPAPAQYPILFVDCEGFNAGEALTDAEKHSDDEVPEDRGRLAVPTSDDRARSVSRGPTPDYHYRVTAPCYGRKGKDGIDLFYARFLYAISDVIVFVTRDDTKIMPQLKAVLEWASAAIYKSINHPSRKTLIIVRHKSELHKAEFYEEGNLATQYLEDHPKLWTASETLQKFVDDYNRSEPVFQRRITTNQRLYEILFRKIICWYVPSKDNPKVKPAKLVRQWTGLRNRIEVAVRDEQRIGSTTNMKYNIPELSRILRKAFEHFTSSEEPFDFYLAARRDNPNPESMGSHLGNFLRHAYEHNDKHGDQFGDSSKMTTEVVVASLLTWTVRRFQQGVSPDEAFERDLRPICDAGIDEYLENYESCSYKFPDGSLCVSRPEDLHLNHASRRGQIVPGVFKRKLKWHNGHRRKWIEDIRQQYADTYQHLFGRSDDNTPAAGKQRHGKSRSIDERVQPWRQRIHRDHSAIWAHIRSYKTCFACLQGVPDHALSCGHSYCPSCVQELGTPSLDRESAWTFTECWLCCKSVQEQSTPYIQLKPRCAGARVLALDGGGIRGVVELALLQELAAEVGLGVPIRDFFDLIVGTSTGGLIALAIATSSKAEDLAGLLCFFKDAATETFSQSMIAKFVSKLGIMMFNITDSLYSADKLKTATMRLFGDETSLFGPALTPGHGQISTRVAVTSSIGYADTMTLISNYNHPQGHNESREEDASRDMRVWEAAMATSAAPYYLPPFRKAETGTMYVDGAVFANCPAAAAYAETKALWPNRAASLDFLVSLSTGQQMPRGHGGLQKFIPNGILRTCTNMLMHQSDSNESWTKFESSSPSTIKAKLHRLDPPITGDRVALDEYKKMDELVAMVKHWNGTEAGRQMIKTTAHAMLASLFFFEPDGGASTAKATKAAPDRSELSGSIRCRLPYNSSGLRKLLEDKADSLWSTVVEDRHWDEEKGPSLYWDPIKTSKGSNELADCIDEETDECRVDLKFTLDDEKSSQRLHILGLKLQNSEKIEPISGFPSTMKDLMERASLRWLQ